MFKVAKIMELLTIKVVMMTQVGYPLQLNKHACQLPYSNNA